MAQPPFCQKIHISLFTQLFLLTYSATFLISQNRGCPIYTNPSVAVYASHSHSCFNQLPTKQENHTLLSACFHCDILSWLEKIESLFWDPQEPLEDTLCGQV